MLREVIEGRMIRKRPRGRKRAMMLDNLHEELIMMNLRVRHRTEKFGEITCLKPANWQITSNDVLKAHAFA